MRDGTQFQRRSRYVLTLLVRSNSAGCSVPHSGNGSSCTLGASS